MKLHALLLAAAVLALPAHGEILGRKPAYLWGGPSSVANEQAITRSMWAPGPDEGYVPQGVGFEAGHVPVSLYRIDIARALAGGKPEDSLTATLRLSGRLKGSSVAFDEAGALRLASSSSRQGTLYRLDPSKLK